MKPFTRAAILLLMIVFGPSVDGAVQPTVANPVRMLVQASHAAGITAIDVSPDGELLVSAGKDGIAKLWSDTPLRLIREARLCEYWLHKVKFVTREQIAFSCGDGTIVLWEPLRAGASPRVVLRTDKQYYRHIAVPYDTGGIVVASDNSSLSAVDTTRNVELWSAAVAPVVYLSTMSNAVLVAFYKQRPALATRPIMTLQVRRATDGQVLHSMEMPDLYSIGWAGVDSNYNAYIRGHFFEAPSGASLRPLLAVNLATGNPVPLPAEFVPPDHLSIFGQTTLDASERLVAVVNRQLLRWKPGDRAVEIAPLPHSERPSWQVITRDARVTASTSRSGVIVRGELLDSAVARTPDASRAIASIAVSPDDRTFAVGYIDGTIQVWSLVEGRPVIRRQLHTALVHSLTFLDDDTVLSVGSDGRALRWNLVSGLQQEVASSGAGAFDSWSSLLLGRLCLREWKQDNCPPRPNPPMGLSIDGQAAQPSSFDTAAVAPRIGSFALGGYETLFVQRLDGQERRKLLDHEGRELTAATSLSFSDSGARLAVIAANARGSIQIVDVASGGVQQTIATAVDDKPVPAGAVQFVPDSDDALVALLTDGTVIEIKLGENAEFAPISPPRPVTGGIALAVSPDGNFVAVGDASGGIEVWDRTRGWAASQLSGHVGMVVSLAFLRDKPLLVSGGLDGSLRVWNVRTGESLAQLANFGADDWLVADDGGFFDGPESSWDRVLFELPGTSAPLQPTRLTQLLFEPGLLAHAWRTERSTKANLEARRDSRATLNPLTLAGRVPPQVSFRTQVSGTEAKVLIRSVDQGSGMRDLRVFRNGTRVAMVDGALRARGSPGAFEMPVVVRLAPGRNVISAYAFDEMGIRSADVAEEINVSAGATPSRIFAVSVGINRYSESVNMPELKYAQADAQAFVASLQALAAANKRFDPKVRAMVIEGPAATKTAITTALRTLGACNAQTIRDAWTEDCPGPNDIVAVLFAGHGVQTNERFLFLPQEAVASSEQQLVDTAVSDLDLEEALAGLDARRTYLVLDTCSSGKIAGDPSLRVGPFNGRGLAQLAYEKGIFILAATQSYRAALEAEKQGHGLLTYALLIDGLDGGNADFSERDGTLWDDEWLRYAVFKVPVLQRGVVEEKQQRGDLLFFPTEPVAEVRSFGNFQVPHLFIPSRRALERLHLRGPMP